MIKFFMKIEQRVDERRNYFSKSELNEECKFGWRKNYLLILGIDPGTAITGYGLVSYEGNHLRKVTFGVIRTGPELSLASRLHHIYLETIKIIGEYRPDAIAIEELFFNKNVRTALAVGHARGVILLAAANSGYEVAEYTPLQVKLAVTGYGRAEKMQIQEMVRVLLCLGEIPKPDDAADALAIAICHAHSCKIENLGARSR